MRQHEEWPSGLKESGQVSEVAPEDRPDESVKKSVTSSKVPLIGKKGIEHLSQS
jgi:hypothetical protein